MSPLSPIVARLSAALSRLPWWLEDILAAVSLFAAIIGVAALFWGFS